VLPGLFLTIIVKKYSKKLKGGHSAPDYGNTSGSKDLILRRENMQVENELKPCPFCGERNRNDLGVITEDRCIPGPEGHIYYKNYNVACSCGALGPDGDIKKEAVERWNRRKGEA
jgi:Lar family restriction alleviation protein